MLIAGGGNATAEVFDPTTSKFTAVSNMSTSRQGAAAILLANGQVLVVGGNGFGKSLLGDLFNPATGTFRTTANKGTGFLPYLYNAAEWYRPFGRWWNRRTILRFMRVAAAVNFQCSSISQ